jgi:hypothetical protein
LRLIVGKAGKATVTLGRDLSIEIMCLANHTSALSFCVNKGHARDLLCSVAPKASFSITCVVRMKTQRSLRLAIQNVLTTMPMS